MNHLLRGIAPLSDGNWKLLDDEARERLHGPLGARRLVDFRGPLGWEHSATDLGRVEDVAPPDGGGVEARRRQVLPLVELRADFSIARGELADNDRGAVDVELEPLDEAALRIATCENAAVFHGWAEAGIAGIAEASPFEPEKLGEVDGYPRWVARAVESVRSAAVGGPYGLALGPDEYTRVIETAEHGGYPLFDHLEQILLGGPIVWAPGVRGAVVVSLRGGDFLFESGQDLAIGYENHDASSVDLFLEESFSFRVATPEAAAALTSKA